MNEVGELRGKVAIVTGGGRGIGRAHALALAREGAAVVVNDLGGAFSGDGDVDTAPADEVVRTIREGGGKAVTDATDVSDWDAVEGLVDSAVRSFGRLDIVVNNAGIARFGTIDTVSRHDWERTIAVNLNGTAALCHWAAAHWRAQGPEAGRRIINTTSGVGLWPQTNNPMYVAAKAGVAALTIACALELAELGVRVNALAPVARTRISEFVVGSEAIAKRDDGFDFWSPEHPAAFATYLASPSCRFTGQIFGIVGDSAILCNGWSVAHHTSGGSQEWSLDAIRAVLDEVPTQLRSTAQGVPGVADHLTPPDATEAMLAEIEN